MPMRPRRRRPRAFAWALALAAASSLALASAVATAQDGDLDDDRVPDDVEDATMRTVDTDAFPPWFFSLTSSSIGAPKDDRFKVTYEEGRFEVQYFREAPGGPSASYRLELRRVFEWRDADVDGGIDESEILAEWSVGTGGFANATLTHTASESADGGQVNAFGMSARWTDRTEGAVTLTLAQRFLRIDAARTLTPMEAKLDVRLNHTLSPGNEDAHVGVEYRIESEGSYAMTYQEESWDAVRGFSEDESWVNVTNAPLDSTMFFSWSNDALVDDVPTAVIVSTEAEIGLGERYIEVRMAFPRAGGPATVRVFHDPALGVVSQAYEGILLRPPEPTLQGDPFLYAVSLGAMAAVVVASVVLANRRRRRK